MLVEQSLCTFELPPAALQAPVRPQAPSRTKWDTLVIRWSAQHRLCWLERPATPVWGDATPDTTQQQVMNEPTEGGAVSYLRVRSLGPHGLCTRRVAARSAVVLRSQPGSMGGGEIGGA